MLGIEPDYADAHYKRGVAKNASGDYQGAINDFDKAIELVPDSATTYNNRGIAKRNLGSYQDAINDFDKAIELDPSYTTARNNREWLLKDHKDHLSIK